MSLKEGDVVTVPCRHCASLSITLVVRRGETVQSCPRCRERTKFVVERDEARGEFKVRSEVPGPESRPS